MIVWPIKFDDLDGNKVEDNFHFHMTKAEITEYALTHKVDLDEQVKAIFQKAENPDTEREAKAELIALFKELLSVSFGLRGPDGRQFLKSEAISQSFIQSDAYSELFVELLSDAGKAAKFLTGIMPKDIADQIPDDLEIPQFGSASKTTETVELPQPEPTVEVSDQIATPSTSVQPEDNRPDWMKEDRVPTAEEFAVATPEQKQYAFGLKLGSPRA